MKKIFLLLLVAVFVVACSSVMLTGRKQLSLVSDNEVNQMSFASYKQLIDSVPLSTDKTNTALVKKVGSKIAAAVESYMKTNGFESQIANFAWEYNLLKDKQVNAFCMPGGKVAVYDGILPVTQTETGLAVVIGHEVAHAIARHSSERLSQQLLVQYGAAFAQIAVSQKSAIIQQGVGALYGVGAQVGLLKYSRVQESEADKLGLIFMSMAGYDPNQAVPFWQRMSANGSAAVPEFLSTHPSDERRISDIQKNLPDALKYYTPVATTTAAKTTTTSKTSSVKK